MPIQMAVDQRWLPGYPVIWMTASATEDAVNLIVRQRARIATLEADNADLATLLAAEREKVAALLRGGDTPFATRAEAELVERAMPANALKHSR